MCENHTSTLSQWGRSHLHRTLASQVLPQAKEPAYIPSRTCALQIGNPRKPPPVPDQFFPSLQLGRSLHLGSPPQTACEQSKAVPAALRYCCGSVSARKAAQNLPVPGICQCGSLMSPHPTGRHGNAILIISLPCWEASSTGAAIPSPVPSLAAVEPREDIKMFSGTSLLAFSSVATPHPTALGLVVRWESGKEGFL